MILSNNNGTFTPVAGGTGTFIGTTAAFNAVKATLPENTVAYITDDGNGDLQPVDAVTNGDMHPVTSNAVYDGLYRSGTTATSIYNWSVDHEMKVAEGAYNYTHSETIAEDGWYLLTVHAVQKNQTTVYSNYCNVSIGNNVILSAAGFISWAPNQNSVVVPLKAGTVINVAAHYDAINQDNVSTIYYAASITKLN